MPGVFLELILNATDLSTAGIEGRDEIDDPLTEALIEGGLGEVSGGGGGSGVVLLDIEIADEVKLDDALAVIRHVLREIGVPASSIIRRSQPQEITYPVYEWVA